MTEKSTPPTGLGALNSAVQSCSIQCGCKLLGVPLNVQRVFQSVSCATAPWKARNVEENPTEPKFRRIKMANPARHLLTAWAV